MYEDADDFKEYVHVAVMDYYPATLYSHHDKYWPNIADALRLDLFLFEGMVIMSLAFPDPPRSVA